MNAQMTYGYVANLPGSQSLPNANGVDSSAGTSAVGGSFNSSGMSGHVNNPFFWALILALLFIGYIGFGFDVNVKRVGEVAVKGGNRA